MALTLHTDAGNFRAFKILIAAEYNDVPVNVPEFKMLKDNVTDEFRKKSPLGKVPVLDTPQGSLFESNAIARYVARLRRDTNLYGVSFFDSAQVDSWIDFCSHEIELAATMWFYPVLGYMPYNENATQKAKQTLANALTVLDNHLADKTYLVGDNITLADITIVSALLYPFKFVADPAYRAPFVNVQRWFDTCVHQPQFQAVIGQVVLCETELAAGGATPLPNPTGAAPAGKGKKDKKKGGDKPKKEKAAAPAPAPAPAPANDEEDEPVVPKKKEKHPLQVLDETAPSEFKGDTWKKMYSNTDNYAATMEEFWKIFDAEGWSIWRADYKYDEDNTVVFMTSNLVGGFIQRSGEIRKWLFGVMHVLNEEKPFSVKGAFLIRGQDIAPLIECNPDAEYYQWTKLSLSDADKATVAEMWCSETTIAGAKIQDSKVFK